MDRHIKLLIWAFAVTVFGVINASIYGNTGSVLAASLGFLSAPVVLGFLGWSESVRMKQKENR